MKKCFLLFFIFALTGCIPAGPSVNPTPTHPPRSPAPSWSGGCLQISQDNALLSQVGSGTILIDIDKTSPELTSKTKNPFLYHVTDQKTEDLYGQDFFVSPDRTMYSYWQLQPDGTERTFITDNQGKVLFSKHLGLPVVAWVNAGFLGLGFDSRYVLIDPYTGKLTGLGNSYPDQASSSNLSQLGDWTASYPPDLSLVLYPALDKDEKKSYVMITVKDQREMARLAVPLEFAGSFYPEWFEDGKRVVVRVNGENSADLIAMSQDGSLETLLKGWDAEYFSIDPNNQTLAFWAVAQNKRSLYWLDMKSKAVFNTCLESPKYSGKPIWSPDGQSLVVELSDGSASQVVVIDIQSGLAVQIAENARPVGWLK